MIKWKRDLICGIVVGIVGMLLFIYAENMITSDLNIHLAQPGVYVRFWLAIMIGCAVLLIIRSLRKKPDNVLPIVFGKMQIFTITLMFLYILMLDKLGFTVCTIILITIATAVYHIAGMDPKPQGKERAILIGKIFIYACAVTIIMYLLFTKVLDARLPTAKLLRMFK